MKFELTPEMRVKIVMILMAVATICAIHLFFNIAKDITTIRDQQIRWLSSRNLATSNT